MLKKILVILGIVAVVAGLAAIFTAGSARASVSPDHLKSGPVSVRPLSVSPDIANITTTYDQAYGGQGGFLHIPDTIGQNVYFSPTGGFVDYDLQSPGVYWVHPNGDRSICMTESTTQKGVIKSEECVFPEVSWQQWVNIHDPAEPSRYKDINNHYSNYLTDPSSGDGAYNATTGSNTSWGNVGSTFVQGT